MNENELSNLIIGQAMKIHTKLSAGLLESVYKECLFYELRKLEFFVETESKEL